jgi:hypothetical protein
MDGTLDVQGTITMDNNGYMDGTGTLTYAGSNVNPNNSGSYIGCTASGTPKYDDNALTGWDNLIASPWDLNACVSLPVELISFNVKRKGNVVVYYWSTGSEINNDYFELQSSIDGINWSINKWLEGAGNSFSKIDYSASVETQDIYFRLKQVDFDGAYSFSNIRIIATDIERPILIHNEKYIIVEYSENFTMDIFDINGRLVYDNDYNSGVVILFKSILNAGWHIIRIENQVFKIYIK